MKNELLQSAYNYCKEYEKSDEYMIGFMQSFANATLDEVLNFLKTTNKTA